MARIRNISWEFWEDTRVAQVSRDARLTFIGLWNQMDRVGVMPYNLHLIRSKIFPYDDLSLNKVEDFLFELLNKGLLFLFEHEGQPYLFSPNFEKHQAFSRSERANPPRYGFKPECCTSMVQVPDKYRTSIVDIGRRTEDGGQSNKRLPDTTHQRLIAKSEKSKDDDQKVAAFMAIWNEVCGIKQIGLPPVKRLSVSRRKHILARLQEEPSLDYWRKIAERIAKSDFCKGLLPGKAWKARFDWFVKPDIHIRAEEGTYDNRFENSTPAVDPRWVPTIVGGSDV